MKKHLIFLLILVSAIAFGQKRHYIKRTVKYFDIDSNEISKKKFLKFLKNKSDEMPWQVLSYPSKKLLVCKLILDKYHGFLSEKEYDTLTNTLNRDAFKPLSEHIIVQFSNLGNFNGNRFDQMYLAKLKQDFSFTNYFVLNMI